MTISQRLTDFKLKTLYSELKVQDKEELQLKRLKADNMDIDGLREAELRKRFGSIIERYGLGDHFDKDLPAAESNQADNNINSNALFKDKKLNKLWMKAESAGFTGITIAVSTVMCHSSKVGLSPQKRN